MQKKNELFFCIALFFVTLRSFEREVTSVSEIKTNKICFVFHSTFCNFATQNGKKVIWMQREYCSF